MATIIVQNRFDGGIASDVREASSNTCALAKHFDIYSKPNRLTPYRDMEDEAGTIALHRIGSVALLTDSGGTTNLYALGRVSASDTSPQFLEKSVNIITGTFAVSTTGADTTGVVEAHTLVAYKTKIFAMKTSGTTDTFLISYDPVTNVLASVGTLAGGYTLTGVYPVMFRHPQDDILYIGSGNKISKLDNATFTSGVLTLPSNLVITSLTDFGSYLAIACAPNTIGGNSFVFLWGRDISLTTLQESIDFGEGFLALIDLVGGTLVGISGSGYATTQVTDITPKITIRAYSGGTPRVIKEIKAEGSGNMQVKNLKAKSKDNLFFVAQIYIDGQQVNQVWVCGRNPAGYYFVTADRLANNDTALTGTVDGFSIVGDYMWTAYNGAGALKRTNDTDLFTATSVYDTLINPGMAIPDRTKKKQLKAASISYPPLPTAGQVVLQYSVDGGAYVTISTETEDSKITTESVKDAAGSAFTAGREYRFRINSTGGAEVTELKYVYDVLTTLL